MKRVESILDSNLSSLSAEQREQAKGEILKEWEDWFYKFERNQPGFEGILHSQALTIIFRRYWALPGTSPSYHLTDEKDFSSAVPPFVYFITRGAIKSGFHAR